MKLESYLQKVDETPPHEIEELVNLSRMVVDDKTNLYWESRDLLTGLIAEKVLLGIRRRRERLGMDTGNVLGLPPRLMPAIWDGFC